MMGLGSSLKNTSIVDASLNNIVGQMLTFQYENFYLGIWRRWWKYRVRFSARIFADLKRGQKRKVPSNEVSQKYTQKQINYN
jgi:hypothetical protein